MHEIIDYFLMDAFFFIYKLFFLKYDNKSVEILWSVISL